MDNNNDIKYRWGQQFIDLIKLKLKKSKVKTKNVFIDGQKRDYDWIVYHLCEWFTDYNMDHLRDMTIKQFKQQYQAFTLYFAEQKQEWQDQYEELINVNNSNKFKGDNRKYGRLYTSL